MAIVLIAPSLCYASRFSKITGEVQVTDTDDSWGVCWVDYDSDGFPDLFVNNISSPNCLYHNDAGSAFVEVTGDPLVTDYQSGRSCSAASWGDVDNDGAPDVIIARFYEYQPPTNFFYLNNGDGTFTRVLDGELATDVALSMGVGWADYDRDGDLDLYVANHAETGPLGNYLYRQDDTGFASITTTSAVTDMTACNFAAWADVNNDNYPDIFKANAYFSPKNDRIYINDTLGGFARLDVGDAVSVEYDSHGGSFGDYDNDGDLDLFVTHVRFGYPSLSTNWLFNNDGGGVYSYVSAPPITSDGAYSYGSVWGDYDNDGYLDLVVANEGLNFLYRNQGDGTFERVLSEPVAQDDATSLAVAWADYDRDGDLDLFVANSNGEPNLMYRNNSTDNAFLSMYCVGTVSNRSAIGARVQLKATISGEPVWQTRELSSVSGRNGQSYIEAHFGLGDAALADSIVISWPSGIVQVLTEVWVNQLLTVEEPQPTCCGVYTGGYTGNTNCDDQGKLNLSDVTALITRVYLSPSTPLCCEENGDVNCDTKLNLSDITDLITRVYIDTDKELCSCSL